MRNVAYTMIQATPPSGATNCEDELGAAQKIIPQADTKSFSRRSLKQGQAPILRVIQDRQTVPVGKEISLVIVAVILLMIFFALGSVSPLLMTEDMQQVVELDS